MKKKKVCFIFFIVCFMSFDKCELIFAPMANISMPFKIKTNRRNVDNNNKPQCRFYKLKTFFSYSDIRIRFIHIRGFDGK